VSEFIIGILLGIIAGVVWSHDRGVDELEAENRQLRDCLRHVAGVVRHRGELPSLVRYIEKLLEDEAGA
jgi:hypothetical protein